MNDTHHHDRKSSQKERTYRPVERAGRKDSGFVKLRRGLREHLRNFPAQALRLWLLLLLNAGWKGSNKALSYFDRGDLSEYLDLSERSVSYWLSWLLQHGYVEIVKHANQHGGGVVRILKFDATTGPTTWVTAGVTSAANGASAENCACSTEHVQEHVQVDVQKTAHAHSASRAAGESYRPLRSEEVEEVSSNKKKKAPSAPARPSALPCSSTVSVQEKSKANQRLPVEKKESDLAALARSKSLAAYRPSTEQECEQRRQKQKLAQAEWLKKHDNLAAGRAT